MTTKKRILVEVGDKDDIPKSRLYLLGMEFHIEIHVEIVKKNLYKHMKGFLYNQN